MWLLKTIKRKYLYILLLAKNKEKYKINKQNELDNIKNYKNDIDMNEIREVFKVTHNLGLEPANEFIAQMEYLYRMSILSSIEDLF